MKKFMILGLTSLLFSTTTFASEGKYEQECKAMDEVVAGAAVARYEHGVGLSEIVHKLQSDNSLSVIELVLVSQVVGAVYALPEQYDASIINPMLERVMINSKKECVAILSTVEESIQGYFN